MFSYVYIKRITIYYIVLYVFLLWVLPGLASVVQCPLHFSTPHVKHEGILESIQAGSPVVWGGLRARLLHTYRKRVGALLVI